MLAGSDVISPTPTLLMETFPNVLKLAVSPPVLDRLPLMLVTDNLGVICTCPAVTMSSSFLVSTPAVKVAGDIATTTTPDTHRFLANLSFMYNEHA